VTEQRVSQGGAEALFRVNPDADVSQAGAEYLHRVQPGVEVSQGGAEYLHRVQPSFAVSQGGVEFLYKSAPCGTRRCQVWIITRTDGVTYRYTSLDRDLTWRGETYRACSSLDPSASENVAEVDSAGSMDLSGALGLSSEAIANGAIDPSALYGGLFDGAEVEAWLVPWDTSNGDSGAKRLLRGTFGAVELGETGYKTELLGDGAKLQQTPLVSRLGPGCRWTFGDPVTCQKDLEPLTVTGTVDMATGVRAFVDSDRTETPGYFKRGRVTFTSGDNAGFSAEFKEHEAGGSFVLWPRLPFPIARDVTYSMTPGCTNIKASSGGCNGCTAWGQLVRYGGFDKVPGRDKRTAAADVRTPD
jgi:uncharacterized phage protein (TIGR02218 family)